MAKVRDILLTAMACQLVEIVIREYGHGKWIQGYRVGLDAKYYPSEKPILGELPHLKIGDTYDIKRPMGLPLKIIKRSFDKLPDEVLDLEVCDWLPYFDPGIMRMKGKESLTCNDFQLHINCYPDGFVPIPIVESEHKRLKIDGQMTITDFPEVMP